MMKKIFKRKKQKNKDTSLFGRVGVLSVGVLLLTVGCFGLFFSDDESNWSQVEGRVLTYEIADESISTRHGISSRFVPRVKYEYSVDITDYVSETVSPLLLSYSSVELAKNDLPALKQGGTVTVYYKSDNPNKSALLFRRPPVFGAYMMIMFGTMAFVLGCVMSFYQMKLSNTKSINK
ncbi:MAG: DUF3592 domain-containing protein [Candidatus Omnitrophica bacterium]|nr:DUF3592 domain-containing protein [Candidatus Omnitrophota bacterium]